MKNICDWGKCNKIGVYKAPVEKDNSRKYRLLCLEHIKIFNKSWNYFADMTSEQVEYLSIYPENSYTFGEQEVIIQEILTNDKVELPNNYHLYPIFPNPFNPTATIKYDIPQVSNVLIEVFDVRGKKINTLQSGIKQPGIHYIKWTNDYHPSGLYIIRMSSENINFTEKVMLVK